MKRLRLFVGLVALASIILIIFGILYIHRGYLVLIKNDTPEMLTKIEISYIDSTINIPILKPGEIFKKRIKPSGDSDLEVKWTDSVGNSYKRNDLAYLTGATNYTIYILLKPKGEIDVKIKTSSL